MRRQVAYFCAAQWPGFAPPLTENPAQDDVGATASSTNSTSKPTKGERDAKSSLDFVSEKLLIDGVGQVSGAAFAAVKETGNRTERQPSHDPQNAPAESAADTISATNSHSPDTLPVEADSAGEAPSSSQASPATDTDDDGDDDVPAFIKQNKPDCLKLKDGHCRLSFATSALCAECNQRRAMSRALA